jgi:predicted MFS family arabinose efflux permease
VQAPLCFIGFLVSRRLLPDTGRGERSAFDGAGAALLGLGVTSLLFAINRGTAWGWSDPKVIAALVAGPVLLGVFLFVESKVQSPLLPLSWLRRRNLVAPITSQTLANFAYMGGFILTPVLLEDGLGIATATVGLLIIARPLAFAVAAPAAGHVTMRVGERVSGVSGAVIVAASMVLLAAIGMGTTYWFIAVALALSGIGLGISSPALGATVANAVRDDELGTAGALQQLMTQVGAVVGVQVMQGVQQATEGSGLIASYGYAYYVGGAVALLGAVCALAVRPLARGAMETAEGTLATT